VDIAGNFARGYQIGSAIIDKYHERNALAALAQQPNDPRALSMLYQVNPQLGQHFEARGAQLQATQRQATLGAQYASGDTRGAEVAAMSAGDFDLAKQFQTLDESKVKTAAGFWEKAGPIAYKLKQTADPAQRQALWQQAKPILQSEGIDQSKLDQFDPTNDQQLDAAIVMSQKVGDLVNQGKPEEFNVEPGAARYQRDPVTGKITTLIAANPGGAPFGAPASSPDRSGAKLTSSQAWQFIAPHEGGYAPHDGNGAPVNFGINQTANPDVDVSKLDAGQAQQLFEKRYWGPSGAASLPAPLAAVHADTYFISPAKSKEFLAASGGDPSKYMDLRDAWMQHLSSTPKYARFAKAWTNRNHDLREFASELSGGHGASSGVQPVSSKEEFDSLPSGTMFIAPDGSRRVKP
jgi:hypothetical protein